MTSSHNLRRWLLTASVLGATALVSACGSAPATTTTERTTTVAPVAVQQPMMMMSPSTTTTTHTESETP